ncbi:MAG: FkbM family methyltransferase [Rhodobacteraceae bacterium]|nr:FkbM family methyltransferase [Paracoccaceae bacterium]
MTQIPSSAQPDDSAFPAEARHALAKPSFALDYSICTLVTRQEQYRLMVDSFKAQGFTASRCEFLYIDNTAHNQGDGYRGLGLLLSQARGAHVILCHQDVIAQDPISDLDDRIAELNVRAPDWALAGNAGVDRNRKRFFRITDRYRFDFRSEGLPAQVHALDENFLVVRAETGLRPSYDLSGFHLYGTDMCLQAAFRGNTAWVIDYHLEHTGRGAFGLDLIQSIDAFEAKYRRVMSSSVQRTNTTTLGIGRRSFLAALHRQKQVRLATGKTGKSWLRNVSDWFENIPLNLREARKGPNYVLDGNNYRIPPNTAYLARKALRRGVYERPERDAVQRFLPRDCPVIELGGSFGIVSNVIRRVLDPDQTLVIVEAIPELAEIIRHNIGGNVAGTNIVSAALAYGADSISFEVTAGVHTSRVIVGTPQADMARQITVPVTSLARLRDAYGIGGRYTLVCDIEGAEFDLLLHEADALAACNTIIMELHPGEYMARGASVTQMLTMLSDCGFHIVHRAENVIVARNQSHA